MPTPTPPPPIAPWLSKRARLAQQHAQLVTERQSFVAHWQAINKVLFPRRGRFSLTDTNRGDRRNKDIVDSTATFAARTLASGMMSGTTSPARDWFRLTTPDPDLADLASVKAWLEQATDRLKTILLKSNFYDAVHMMYGDLGVYGTSVVFLDEDDDDDVRCYTFPIGSYCLGNDGKNRARIFTREYQMTVRQLVLKFGFEQCSTAVQNAWRQGTLEALYPVVHVITSNAEYDTTKLAAQYKPFSSCYFEGVAGSSTTAVPIEDKLLSESGYDEFPLLVARWDVTAEDAYATDCPGMTALGDINQLQMGERRGLQALDKVVNPPLIAPSTLQRAVISQLPGGVTYDDGDAKTGLRTLHEVRPDLDKLEAKQNQVRERIREAFYTNMFLMTSYLDDANGRQPVTAAEIGVRQEEKLLALGPVLERLNKDVYHPLIDRVFAIAVRRGLIPPAPAELEGSELKVEYLSIMHAAQKAGGLNSLERFVGFVIRLAEGAQDPSVLDRVDTDKLIESYHDMAGAPAAVLRSDDATEAIRQQRQQQAQAAAAAEQLKTAGAGVQSLANAPTNGPNALTDLLAQVGAPVS